MNNMEDLIKRLHIIEKFCSQEYHEIYYELKKCRDKAINMCYIEFRNGQDEHYYSNLWSCVYDCKKRLNIEEDMETLMQFMKDIDFNIDKKFQAHNFKVSKGVIL